MSSWVIPHPPPFPESNTEQLLKAIHSRYIRIEIADVLPYWRLLCVSPEAEQIASGISSIYEGEEAGCFSFHIEVDRGRKMYWHTRIPPLQIEYEILCIDLADVDFYSLILNLCTFGISFIADK